MASSGLPASALDDAGTSKDAVRVQAAAVAAQQAALVEEEDKLDQRRTALESQESQLAAHLENKRLKLLQLSERTQAERAAIASDRLAYEEHIAKVTGDLTEPQRELLDGRHKLELDRKRLASLHQRIRQRWHRFWLAERQKFEQLRDMLANEGRAIEANAAQLQFREEDLTNKRLRLHTLGELSRCQLREAWQNLYQEQRRWKQRRGKERAALKIRERDVETAERRLLEAQRLFITEKRTWDAAKNALQAEAQGLDHRIANQRQTLGKIEDPLKGAVPEKTESTPGNGEQETQRHADLERLASALADQRVQLLEQWQRLANIQADWDKDRHGAARDLEALAKRLVETGRHLAQRRHTSRQADEVLRQRHEELVEVRRQMIAWRARLRLREKSWEGERQRLLLEVRNREELADQHLNTLVDLRQRWAGHRREELEKLQRHHRAMETAHKEHGRERLVLADQATALEGDKRIVAEKSLALEQYRNEFLAQAGTPGADRRLERLRRRWITLNATAIRNATREREALKESLQILESRHAELHARAGALARAEFDLIEKQTAWEHKQALATARHARVQQQIQNAEAQRNLSERQVARMKEEIERIAQALIDEPDPPTSDALSDAA